ncbi:hypothetical protein SAMN05444274_103489 [Mariniphaga anaerophila]|uniref:Uncharacterized protein n=1 Tax=Mariniphaga anaerophila TaxID=1484053 RepID=A0A1M4YWL6_9BACT|nr:hypothetical protein SAMN05444274_103489 [Mariniphaga anaerophila]
MVEPFFCVELVLISLASWSDAAGERQSVISWQKESRLFNRHWSIAPEKPTEEKRTL